MLALDILNKYKINKYRNLCSGIYLGDDYSDGVDSYSKDIEECNEAIEELEKLNSRSCERCKYSFDIFTGIDDSLLGEDFICTKLEVDKVFNKDFYCSEWESKC